MALTAPLLRLTLRRLDFEDAAVLGDLTLTLAPAETLALVGPSGIGKTSLLRIIAGLEDRFEGTCELSGRAAVVFQEPTLLPWRSVGQNLCVTTGITPPQARAALAEVGLAGREDDFPHQLSLGQQRRVALARAFAVKPDVLLLDEPFVSLDPEMVDEMITLLQRLCAAHRVAVILVTHVETEVARLADRIVTLGGRPARITGETRNRA